MVSVIKDKLEELEELCRRFYVSRLEVFGSAAAGDMRDTSDLDFLVEFDPSVGDRRFDTFFALKDALERLFGRPVDLVEPGGLRNPYFVRSINETRKVVYAAS